MDQIKIGKFIATCRKKQGLSQASLAEKLNISDRAVSKWETGKSMPDSSIMLDLCNLLKINVNELLSGEYIKSDLYDKYAENNLLSVKKELEDRNKELLKIEILVSVPALLAGLVMMFIVKYIDMPIWVKTILIVTSISLIMSICFISIFIEQKAGYYECQNCHHKYMPKYWTILVAPHINRARYMKCPNCKKLSWNKKVISLESDE